MSMASEQFDPNLVKNFWLSEAEEALHVANHLVEKMDYSYALFFGHLAIEKILKSIYVIRNKAHAPPTHNLLRLAKQAGLNLSESQSNEMVTVTSFNIEGRYPDFKKPSAKSARKNILRIK